MSGSEASTLECGCGKGLLFGFQLESIAGRVEPGRLFHSDGTLMCSMPEPEATAPAAIWTQYPGVPYVSGRVGAISPALRTYVDPPEERDRPPVLGVAVLLAFLVSLVVLCGLGVSIWWPL